MVTAQERLVALERQAEKIQRHLRVLSERSNSYKLTQLGLFVGGILIAISALALYRWLGVFVGIGALVALFFFGSKLRIADQSALKYRIYSQMIQTQIARIRLDWSAIPPVAPRDTQEDHPFDTDLDLSGERSLHQLLNVGVSIEGIQQLRDWLLCLVPDLDIIRKRQALLRELIPATSFRNKLLLNSLISTRFTGEPLDGERLVTWLEDEEQTGVKLRNSTVFISIGLWLATIMLLLFYFVGQLSPLFAIVCWLVYIGWSLSTKKEQGNLSENASFLNRSFMQLGPIFEFLEKYPYRKQSQLRILCEPFYLHGDRSPSLMLKKLQRITSRATLGSSGEGWLVLNACLPISVYTAYQFKRQNALLTEYMPLWLDAWYELEALCSLANFAYLNPDYIMPEIIADKKQEQEVVFRTQGLGHPLIAHSKKVSNDFSLSDEHEILLITGSNMAGKSTFLRSMGINLCLAFAGSVVNATSFQTSLFELYACIKVTDSLADGYSYFYAEVHRLKGLLTLLEEGTQFPLFFLIDEIFKGTNNYERLIGSEAYIRALAGKRCVGAISTHDLELVKLADALPMLKNYHFKEDVVDGHMVFDYILHAGPCPTRNALKIMQLEGLPIKWDTQQIATT